MAIEIHVYICTMQVQIWKINYENTKVGLLDVAMVRVLKLVEIRFLIRTEDGV